MRRIISTGLEGFTLKARSLRAGSLALIAFIMSVGTALALQAPSSIADVPVKGRVTMVEIGSDQCLPCRMMAPIISEIEREYAGKAMIISLDAFKDPEKAQRFDVRVIPTQIFYDLNGEEIYRHEGFFDKAGIVGVLEKAGAR